MYCVDSRYRCVARNSRASIGGIRASYNIAEDRACIALASGRDTGQLAGKSGTQVRRAVAVFIAGIVLLAPSLDAADLQTQTAENYERYIALTQTEVDAELAEGNAYLWVEQ